MFTASRLILRSTYPPKQANGYRRLPKGGKRARREAEYSAQMKNVCRYASIPPVRLQDVEIIKYGVELCVTVFGHYN